MMKFVASSTAKCVMLGLLAAAFFSPLAARADSIQGSFGISGDDTYTPNSVTFDNSDPGIVITSSVPGLKKFQDVFLASFTSSDAVGKTLFTTTNSTTGITFSLVITQLSHFTITNTGALDVTGYGIYSETGYTNTLGSFTLTSSTSGSATTFQLNGTVPDSPAPPPPPTGVTPEPNSLALLGTGLVSTAGLLLRRRSMLK